MVNADHERFMRRAIELSALAALEYGTGGPFGAVVVKDNKIVAEGMNRVLASHDPTWHGEIEAIRLACITLQSCKLTGCTLYTTSEPCPMCVGALLESDVEALVFASPNEIDGAAGTVIQLAQSNELPRRIRLVTGIRRDEAEELFATEAEQGTRRPTPIAALRTGGVTPAKASLRF